MMRRLTVDEAAAAARRHPQTVRRALEAGRLHGTQRVVGGRWTVREDCLEAWCDGEPCAHQAAAADEGGKTAAVVPLRGADRRAS